MRLLICIGIALCAEPASMAQNADAERSRQASATLPESNEALLLSGRVDDAIRAGDFRLAVELIGQVQRLPAELVEAPASRTRYPVWYQAHRLLSQLPDGGLELYRQLYDAEVSARLAEAIQKSDLHELRELFRLFPATSKWHAAGMELATRLIDSGSYAEAIEVLAQLGRGSSADDSGAARAMLSVALASAGAEGSAERILDQLGRDTNRPRADGQWRVDEIRSFVNGLREQRGAADGARQLPLLRAAESWSAPFSARDDDADAAARELAEAIGIARRFPLLDAACLNDTIVLRLAGTVYAFDSLALTPRWSAVEMRPDSAVNPGATPAGEPVVDADGENMVGVGNLLRSHLLHTLAADSNHVFTIESVWVGDNSGDFRGRQPFQAMPQLVARNELVARRTSDGRTLWRTGADPSHPLHNAAFQDRPLIAGDEIIVAYTLEASLRLAALDAATGALRREASVVTAPMHFDNFGGRCLLAADATTVYVCTGNGVVAALGRDDFSWRWALTYNSTLAQHLGQTWWQPRRRPIESGVDRPLLADDLLVVAPVDSLDIFAVDRFSGVERWRIPRRDTIGVVGAVEGGLVLAGARLTCVDLADPDRRPLRWRSMPIEIFGRPALDGRWVHVPTRMGIISVDGVNGKICGDQFDPDSTSVPNATPALFAGNLFAAPDGLFAVGTSRITKLPDEVRTRAHVEKRLAANPSDPYAALAIAWVDSLAGQTAAALARLETIPASDRAIAHARDRLLSHVFMRLASATGSDADRLAWLRKAARLAGSGESAARLARVIGRVLEQQGQWAEAAEHYLALIGNKDPRLAIDDEDAARRSADWLFALQRLRSMSESNADAIRAALEAAIERWDADGSAVRGLQRLLAGLEKTALRERIAGALLTRKLPAEWLLRSLPSADSGQLDAESACRALLMRWDGHVSGGMLAEARVDEAAFRARFAEAGAVADESEAARQVRKWVSQIEVDQRKIAAAVGKPFVADDTLANRRWRIMNAELLVDSRRPMTAVRGWIPVRQHELREIQLIDSMSYQSPWRQTEDFVVNAASESRISADDLHDAMVASARAFGDDARRSAWPIAIYEQFAAVPVPGGMVCTGIGPGRGGRKRIWDFPVSTWPRIPADFEQLSDTGPHGVYVCPRADRVMLVGWVDGRCWWQRDFAGSAIERVTRVGDRVIVFTRDERVYTLDALWGDDLRSVPVELGTLRALEIAGGLIVVSTSEAIIALDPRTLERRWSTPARECEALLPVAQSDWLAYRPRPDGPWALLDGASGIAICEGALADLQDIRALALDGAQLLAVSSERHDADPSDPSEPAFSKTRISAYDALNGKSRWTRDTESTADVNLTQLCGHADLIPLLVPRHGAADRNGAGPAFPRMQLLDKRDGTDRLVFSIADKYEALPNASLCDSFVLVNSTRIMVQIAGNVLAFGNPPGHGSP